jgi:hypothetical protein
MQDHDPEAVTELATLRFADAIAVPVFALVFAPSSSP